jgi:hypothetical protein
MTPGHGGTKKGGNGAYHVEKSANASPLPNFHKYAFGIEDERSRLRYDGWRKVCDWKPVSYEYQKYLDTRVKLGGRGNRDQPVDTLTNAGISAHLRTPPTQNPVSFVAGSHAKEQMLGWEALQRSDERANCMVAGREHWEDNLDIHSDLSLYGADDSSLPYTAASL